MICDARGSEEVNKILLIALIAIPIVLVLVFFGGEIVGLLTGASDPLRDPREDEPFLPSADVWDVVNRPPGEPVYQSLTEDPEWEQTVQILETLWRYFLDFRVETRGERENAFWDPRLAWCQFLLDHHEGEFVSTEPPNVVVADGWGGPIEFRAWELLEGNMAEVTLRSAGPTGNPMPVQVAVRRGPDGWWGTLDDCLWRDTYARAAPDCWR